MKWYEIRASKDNKKVFLNIGKDYRGIEIEGTLFYDDTIEGLDEFDFTTVLKQVDDNMFVPEFEEEGYCISKTRKKLLKMNFNVEKAEEMSTKHRTYDMRFNWVINTSSHRKDVRLVDERYFQALRDGKTNKIIVVNCENVNSKYPYSFERKTILATKAIHQTGDISREKPDYAYVWEADDENWVGYWAEGFGFIGVEFPKATSTIVAEVIDGKEVNVQEAYDVENEWSGEW